MKVQEAKIIVDGLQKELSALSSDARSVNSSADELLDQSQFIAFEIVRVTAELDAVGALLSEDLSGNKETASPELVIALNEVVAEVAGLRVRLKGDPGVAISSSPASSDDYRRAVEAIAATRNIS
jgi:hypothetical protein